MILARYFTRQILQALSAITLLLLTISLTSRFIQYLSQAVAGELSSDVLLQLILFRLPDFLLVILPFAFFISLLLTYGRMYADNEMVVLMSSGVGPRRLLLFSCLAGTTVAGLMAILSLSLAPWGIRSSEEVKLSQQQLTEVDLIVPGQFQPFSGGERVTYTETIQPGQQRARQLGNVFIALVGSQGEQEASPRIVLAETAHAETDLASGSRFMRLENVLQYDGIPGQADWTLAQSDAQSILLPDATEFEQVEERQTLTTAELLVAPDRESEAELYWRFSLVLFIPVLLMIAVPLGRVSPRQGRYNKLIGAALIYALYFTLLQTGRDAVADQGAEPLVRIGGVHLVFVAFAVCLQRWPGIDRLFALGRT